VDKLIVYKNMNILEYISLDASVRFGKPCIKGTRIAITDILQWLASGMTYDDIYEDFPEIKHEHILAALTFAANRESLIKIISEKYETAA